MDLFETYLLLGIALGIIALIRIFASAVDGTRPTFSVLFLFIAIGMIWYANHISGKTLGIADVQDALKKLFAEATG